VFDFYGHGRSPWPGIVCTLDVFVDQTKGLLNALGLGNIVVSVIGHDFGGAVALGFAAKYPSYCRSLTLISPQGLVYNRKESEKWLYSSTSIKRYFMPKRLYRFALAQKDDFYDTNQDGWQGNAMDQYVDMILWQIKHTPGYVKALLSTHSKFPMRRMDELFSAVGGRRDLPTLIIWGAQDTVSPTEECMKRIEKSFGDRAFIVQIPRCGHHPLAERFDEVMTEMLSFQKLVQNTYY
jgi:pimeloyl-ACP methyl ester carboxylesterase